MIKPVIVVVGYNRPKQTKRLLESIGNANYSFDDVTLVVSIDQSNKSDQVEVAAKNFKWTHGEKIIRRFPERQGLRKHIISCGDLCKKYGAVIILEDDLYVSKDFYTYTSNAQAFYSYNKNICGISLYNFRRIPFTNYTFNPDASEYDTYLGQMVVTWGQSWTQAQWDNFKKWYLENEDELPKENLLIPDEISGWNRSWGKYFASYMAEKGLFYVYPYISRTTCFSDVGEHNADKYETAISQVPIMSGVPETYRFAPFNLATKYDSFYERLLPEDISVGSVNGDEISFDLNGMKRSSLGKKYIITSKKLDYDVIASFAISMRPIEKNVLDNIQGNYFRLYALPDECTVIPTKKKAKYRYEQSYERLKYEHFDMTWRMLFYYTIHEIGTVIKLKLKQLLSRRVK